MSNNNNNFGSNPIEKYEKLERIGSGTYGMVYKGKDLDTGENVALKKMMLKIESEGVPSTTIREISLLREIIHPNIVKLKDVVQDQQTLYLIFEQLDMDLREKLNVLEKNKNETLSELSIKKILYEILKGVQAIHSKRILHRDLKPQNILLSKDGSQIKIADFGLSRTYAVPNRPYTNEVVTLWYRPPELLLGAIEYSTPVDMWSVGCIFGEIVTNQPLFNGDSEIDQIGRIIRILGTPDEKVWPGVTSLKNYNKSIPNYPLQNIEQSNQKLKILNEDGLDLLNKMLTYDPTKRITAKQALKHKYFKEFQVKKQNKNQQMANQFQPQFQPSANNFQQFPHAQQQQQEQQQYPQQQTQSNNQQQDYYQQQIYYQQQQQQQQQQNTNQQPQQNFIQQQQQLNPQQYQYMQQQQQFLQQQQQMLQQQNNTQDPHNQNFNIHNQQESIPNNQNFQQQQQNPQFQ